MPSGKKVIFLSIIFFQKPSFVQLSQPVNSTRVGRPRKNETLKRRDQLLEQSFHLFATYGYGALSLETIAREARVSLRTIYAQFGGKAGLFRAAICQYSDRFVGALPEAALTRDQPLAEGLQAFGEQYLYQVLRPELVSLRSQVCAEAHRFPELAREFYTMGPGRSLDYLSQFLRIYQQNGVIGNVDTDFVAGEFLNMLKGETYQRVQLGLDPTPSRETIARWTSRVVNLFLAGCLKHSESAE
jgi:AcrR family transcriptional regulator